MNNSSDNLGWDDPEDTLPPIPDEPEQFGPDTPSQGGDFRFVATAGEAWADAEGVPPLSCSSSAVNSPPTTAATSASRLFLSV